MCTHIMKTPIIHSEKKEVHLIVLNVRVTQILNVLYMWKTLFLDSPFYYTLKMLGCFNPTLGEIWINSNVGLKM